MDAMISKIDKPKGENLTAFFIGKKDERFFSIVLILGGRFGVISWRFILFKTFLSFHF